MVAPTDFKLEKSNWLWSDNLPIDFRVSILKVTLDLSIVNSVISIILEESVLGFKINWIVDQQVTD